MNTLKTTVPKKIASALKAANRYFKTLTRAQKRVKIAQDVIEHLDLKKIRPVSCYFAMPERVFEMASNSDLDVSEVTSQVRCNVCGIGALFVAAVERADEFKFSDFYKAAFGDWDADSRRAETDYLKQWFSLEQLDLVEEYFERRTGMLFGGDRDRIRPLIKREKSPSKRMRMIMENIISNKGKFDPSRGAHANPKEQS